MPPGETAINDICLTPSGYGLFSAAADKVKGVVQWYSENYEIIFFK